jgi:hypothetical protein
VERVVQLKTGEIQVIQGGELDSGASRQPMTIGQDLGIDFVIIGLNARRLGKRGQACQNKKYKTNVRTP